MRASERPAAPRHLAVSPRLENSSDFSIPSGRASPTHTGVSAPDRDTARHRSTVEVALSAGIESDQSPCLRQSTLQYSKSTPLISVCCFNIGRSTDPLTAW